VNGYLLDTNVVSMLSPSQTEASAEFLDWLERADRKAQVFLSVITVHEIERGIASLDQKGASAKAAGLRTWQAGLLATFDDKILTLHTPAASLSGRLEAQALAAGHHPGMADALIAGIARTHDVAVVTRNAKHFRPFGIIVLSPEEAVGRSV
jgi:predicted nucleic acid-binding protein